MKRIATCSEMQAIDAYSIHEIGIPGMVLMEKAAMALYDEVTKRIDHHSRSLIVVEKGNNGGDGLALGRMLSEQGYRVDIYEIGGIPHASESYQAQKRILENLDIPVYEELPDEEYDVIIDAVFGVGLTRDVAGIHKNIIYALNCMKGYKIAVDVPSGVDASTGKVLGTAFKADLTVTFGLSKVGLLLFPGASYAGEVVVKDIGFPYASIEEVDPTAFTYEPGDERWIPSRKMDSHKGSYGKVLIIAGGVNMAGAAYLSGKAAYKTGCGLVRVFTREENRVIMQTLLPEAILTTYTGLEDGMAALPEAIHWADVIVVGPGLGRGEHTEWFLHLIQQNAKVPVVIDADGLNEISAMDNRGEDFLKAFSVPVILTPHMLEMGRLTGCTVEEIKNQRMTIGKDYVEETGTVLVLKDSRSVVFGSRNGSSKKKESIYINTTGNNGMATGGSGDVLSGMIGGMLAEGMEPFFGAAMAVYLHGRCGDEAAKELGQASLMAGNLIDYLPAVLK